MGVTRRLRGAATALLLLAGRAWAQSDPSAAAAAPGPPPEALFRQAGELVRSGDSLKGVAAYREIAASGVESASLYWNWAQAAGARGEVGEALWAALRARELEPADRALPREIQRLREAANLDAAEISPEPLAVLGRASRRFHLGLLALVLAGVSVLGHALARLLPASRWPAPAAWGALALALLAGSSPLLASFARPTGVVVRRESPLLDSASPTAGAIGTLRQGEVVPLLERSAGYVRVEDSSGARGWAHRDDVWPLGEPPRR
jgi:hypothetical protein